MSNYSGKKVTRNQYATRILSTFCLLLLTPIVTAQVLEEITVTAQKRAQSIQKVPISITALTGDQMKDLGIGNTTEITQQVPGLQLNTWSPTITFFNIRGVSQNNFLWNTEAPVAVYMDDVYISSMNAISGQLFDIERLEVLRGPQGTLFGRNATGGVVHYLSRQADQDEFNGYLETSYGEYDKYYVEGAVGGGLTESLRARLSGRVEKSDGYIESVPLFPGAPTSGVDVGGTDGFALRGTLQADLSSSFKANFIVRYSEDDDVPTGGFTLVPQDLETDPLKTNFFTAAPNGFPAGLTDDGGFGVPAGPSPNPHEHNSGFAGSQNREVFGVSGKLEWQLDNGMELVSITGYNEMDQQYLEDGDGLPFTIINVVRTGDWDQFTQELRLSGQTDRMQWQVGGYYMDMNFQGDDSLEGNVTIASRIKLGLFPIPAVATGIDRFSSSVDSENWSIFGQGTYALTDTVSVTAGLRWSQDDKKTTFVTTHEDPINGGGAPIPRTTVFDLQAALAANPAADDVDKIDYGDWAGRLQIDWHPNDDLLVFASINRGIKGGNWTLQPDVDLTNIQHKEEVLYSYEIGFKSTLMDGRARLNATAFYYDYNDYQVFSIQDTAPQIANSDAEAYGAEIELYLSPAEGWDFIVGASFEESKVDTVATVQETVLPGGFFVDYPVDFQSADLPNAPNYSFNFLGRYAFPMFNGEIAMQIDGVAYGDQNLESTGAPLSQEDAYIVANAVVSYTTSDGHWKGSIWVKNFTDAEYRLYDLDLGALGGTGYFAPPRWLGGTLSYSW